MKKLDGFERITKDEKVRVIEASMNAREWIEDKKGYFLIRIDKEKRVIEAGFCDTKTHKVKLVIVGKHPLQMYYTILRENLVSSLQHAAYLGMELQKAYAAIQFDGEYVQDIDMRKRG